MRFIVPSIGLLLHKAVRKVDHHGECGRRANRVNNRAVKTAPKQVVYLGWNKEWNKNDCNKIFIDDPT